MLPPPIPADCPFILLPGGLRAFHDAGDAGLLDGWDWRPHACPRVNGPPRHYAVGYRGKEYAIMHRLILGSPPSQVDHWNGDTLDNRRGNLRLATPAQNSANGGPRRGRVLKGTSRQGRRWLAKITVNRVTRVLGSFLTEEAAARAYDAAALAAWGEFARTNFPTA